MSNMDAAHLTWRKSSYSGNEGGACLEVAAARGIVLVRDSKDPASEQLAIHRLSWAEFVRYAAQS